MIKLKKPAIQDWKERGGGWFLAQNGKATKAFSNWKLFQASDSDAKPAEIERTANYYLFLDFAVGRGGHWSLLFLDRRRIDSESKDNKEGEEVHFLRGWRFPLLPQFPHFPFKFFSKQSLQMALSGFLKAPIWGFSLSPLHLLSDIGKNIFFSSSIFRSTSLFKKILRIAHNAETAFLRYITC